MRQPGVKNKSLCFAERVEDAVEEAHEKAGGEVHGTGRVEQNNESQWLFLAPVPDQIDRRSPVGDAAMDGAAQIEPAPAAFGLRGANESLPHAARPGFGERMWFS